MKNIIALTYEITSSYEEKQYLLQRKT